MKKFTLISMAVVFTLSAWSQSNVGIGTNIPKTKLQVAGAVSSTPSSAAAATTVVIPDNVTTFQLTAGSGPSTLSVANPQDGQFLLIENDDANQATFTTGSSSSVVIPAGGMASFLYLAADLKWIETGNNNTGSNAFNAGTGLSWSGNTLNSNWTANGSNLYPSSTSSNVGIGNTTPGSNLLNVSTTAASSGAGNGIRLEAQSSSNGAGGTINISGGNAGGTNNNGGNILLTPGTATGAGSAGNVAINSDPNATPSAVLDVYSTNQGMLPPRMTTAQRNAINVSNNAAVQGLTIFNTTTDCLEAYIGTSWQPIGCGCTSAPAVPGAITGPTTVCQANNTNAYSVPEVAGAAFYTWNLPTGATMVSQSNGGVGSSVVIQYNTAGAAEALTVQAGNNCGTSAANAGIAVTVDAYPVITSQPAASSVICADVAPNTGNTSFSTTASGYGLSFQWNVSTNGGTSWNPVTIGSTYTVSNVTVSSNSYTSSVTSTLNITGVNTSYNAYQYQCVVSGTCASPSAPVTSTSSTLTVNQVPVITTPAAITTCSGSAVALTPTGSYAASAVPTYTWAQPVAAGLTGLQGQATASANFNCTLTNTTTAPVTAVYSVTPTSYQNGINCSGSAFNVSVTVEPSISITNSAASLTPTICSGSSTNITLTSSGTGSGNVSYAWNAATSLGTGISCTAGCTGNANPFAVTLANSTGTIEGNAVYSVTPSYNINSQACPGTPKTITVTVEPVLTITNSAITPTICSGTATNITLTSSASGGAGTVSYAWPNPTGLSTGITSTGGSPGSASPFAVTLTNSTGTTEGTATYSITPSYKLNSVTCPGTAYTATVTVEPVMTVTNSAVTPTICSGGSTNITLTNSSAGSGTVSYAWPNPTGLSTGITSVAGSPGTSSPFAVTLTNSNTAKEGTATYSITPTYTLNGQQCAGTAKTFTVTVEPVLTITNSAASLTPTICSGSATNITLTSSASGGSGMVSYAWPVATLLGTGISCTAGCTGSASTFAVTLTNSTGTIEGNAVYGITPSYTLNSQVCPGTTATATITVEPVITITNTPINPTVCGGTSNTITLNNSAAGSGTVSYGWPTATSLSGASCSAGCTGSAASSFTLTLAATTTTAIGTAVYTVTPTYKLNTISCPGTPVTATITVVPKITLATAPSGSTITSCVGTNVPTITLSAASGTSGTGSFSFNWSSTTNNTGINPGLAGGTGVTSITGFTSTNAANTTTVSDAINVTPVYTVNSIGCPGTAQSPYFNYTTNPIPLVSANYTPNACSGVAFSVSPVSTTGTANTTYSWPAPAGTGFSPDNSQTLQSTVNDVLTNTQYPTPTTATYTVTPTYTYGGVGCSSSSTFTVTVTLNPTPVITPSYPSGQTICTNNAGVVNLSDGGLGGSFSWTYSSPIVTGAGNCSSSCGTTIPYTLVNNSTTNTVGTMTYTISDVANGCTGTATATVNVTPNEDIVLTSAASTTAQEVCISTPITNITYTLGSDNDGTTVSGVSGLPTGVNWSVTSGVLKISGTPTVSGTTVTGTTTYGLYPYTVNLTGTTCTADVIQGTIQVDAASSTGSFGTSPIYSCDGATTAGTLYNLSGTPTNQTITGYVGTIQGWGFGTSTTCSANTSGYPGNAGNATNEWPCCYGAPGNATEGMVEVKNGVCAVAQNCFTPVLNAMSAPTSASVSPASACSPVSGNITLSYTGGSSGAYLPGGGFNWYSGSCGGTLVGSGNNLVIAAPSSTTTYYVEPFDVCGPLGTCASATYTVNGAPGTPTFNQTNPLSVNEGGGAFTLTASATGSSPTYAWSSIGDNFTQSGTSGASITLTPPAASYGIANGGNQVITVTATNSCGSTQASFTVQVHGTQYYTAATAGTSATVPNFGGNTPMTVYLWGAGGGGAFFGGSGGAGGYVSGTYTVAGGAAITVIVGGGGATNFETGTNNAAGAAAVGGGGTGVDGSSSYYESSGSGGGMSAIKNGATYVAVAGGGGGSGSYVYTYFPWGGPGGSTTNGEYSYLSTYPAGGQAGANGGAGGTYDGVSGGVAGIAGSAGQGGAGKGGSTYYFGGGGGGGYPLGGGGGAGGLYYTNGGGGGGASYTGGLTGATNTPAVATYNYEYNNPVPVTNSYYTAAGTSAGIGGIGDYGPPTPGNVGLVVIVW